MITINVTQEDIDNGTREQCAICPVARALDKAFGLTIPLTNIADRICFMPDSYHIDLFDKQRYLVGIPTPFEAKVFIKAFDAKQPVKPFSFQIDETPFLPWVKSVAEPFYITNKDYI